MIERRVYMEPKKLYRSSTNRMICGVCQGLAEYINLDPTVVRLLWVIFSIFGVGVLVYIVAAIIMPVKEQY
jgi:phage shock protein C